MRIMFGKPFFVRWVFYLFILLLLEKSIDSIIAKATTSPVQIAKTVRYASGNIDGAWLVSVVGRGEVV
jgi:predicted small secreted protein